MRILAAALLVMLAATQAVAERRVALIIGNGAYSAAPDLPNPVRDAEAVAGALSALGFEVTAGYDLDAQGMRARLRSFGIGAEGADVAVFFYAGHGIQMAGRNYLIPTDAELRREGDLDLFALPLDLVIGEMERAARTTVVLLDACRDNPFEAELTRSIGRTRSAGLLGRGLAPVDTAGGLFVGFATDPGKVAFDGAGAHSPFTEAVLDHIRTRGLEINAMMTRVRADVFTATGGRQRPWSTSSLLRELYLAPEAPVPAPDPAEDLAMWESLGAASGPQALRRYLAAFPEGLFADVANARLAALTVAAAPDVIEDAARTEPRPVPPDTEDVEREPLPSIRPEPAPDRLAALMPDPEPPATPAALPSAPDCAHCPVLVGLAGGDTVLGSSDPSAPAAERPATAQRLAPFSLAKREVTVGLVRRYEAETGNRIPRGCFVWTADGRMRKDAAAYWGAPGYSVTDSLPAACLNWEDAGRIADWLNATAGGGFRLPSEAEFEYALKAGGDGIYPWEGGAAAACRHANAADSSARFRWRNTACADGAADIAEGGSYPANAFGLYDLSGNLWEWTGDCWNGSHEGAPADGRARTRGQCASRVLRGGSWDDPPENLRVTYRVGIPATRRQANVGVRLAQTPP